MMDGSATSCPRNRKASTLFIYVLGMCMSFNACITSCHPVGNGLDLRALTMLCNMSTILELGIVGQKEARKTRSRHRHRQKFYSPNVFLMGIFLCLPTTPLPKTTLRVVQPKRYVKNPCFIRSSPCTPLHRFSPCLWMFIIYLIIIVM